MWCINRIDEAMVACATWLLMANPPLTEWLDVIVVGYICIIDIRSFGGLINMELSRKPNEQKRIYVYLWFLSLFVFGSPSSSGSSSITSSAWFSLPCFCIKLSDLEQLDKNSRFYLCSYSLQLIYCASEVWSFCDMLEHVSVLILGWDCHRMGKLKRQRNWLHNLKCRAWWERTSFQCRQGAAPSTCRMAHPTKVSWMCSYWSAFSAPLSAQMQERERGCTWSVLAPSQLVEVEQLVQQMQ